MVITNGTRSGSVLLVMIIFLMSLSVIMYSFLRNSAYMLSIAREREKSEEIYYYAYSFQQFILAHYKDTIKKAQDKTTIFKKKWPSAESCYNAIAWIEEKNKIKTLFVSLKFDKKPLVTLSLLV